jgi:ribosome modulation factor
MSTSEMVSPEGAAFADGFDAQLDGKPREAAPEKYKKEWLEGWDKAQAEGPFDDEE